MGRGRWQTLCGHWASKRGKWWSASFICQVTALGGGGLLPPGLVGEGQPRLRPQRPCVLGAR